jgi:hypothetical protein
MVPAMVVLPVPPLPAMAIFMTGQRYSQKASTSKPRLRREGGEGSAAGEAQQAAEIRFSPAVRRPAGLLAGGTGHGGCV